jgi:hypothetical protein
MPDSAPSPSLQRETISPDSAPARWLLGWQGNTLAFLWGFAEGTLFFILPDVPLSLTALYSAQRAFWQIWAIVAGALLGGSLMFSWSAQSPAARTAVARVPLISPAMFERVDRDFREYGVWGVSRGPLRGIPYKVYAVEAPAHSSLWPFLVGTIPARLWRLLGVWLAFSLGGIVLRHVQKIWAAPWLHGAIWIVVYTMYWIKVTG